MSNTSIFARINKGEKQILIYNMTLDADEELAMILPIPVKKGTAEDGLNFVNLEKSPDLFSDINDLFPKPPPTRGIPTDSNSVGLKQTAILEVQNVGNFEASFVPRIEDFARLDERFRIEPDVWKKLPQYKNFGFAVFKLKAGKGEVHPMAFEFPTATPESIFFPTVHIHDGKVHKNEKFDHSLYCQTDSNTIKMTWTESLAPPGAKLSAESKQTLNPDEHVYKRRMVGRFKNEDVIIAAS